MARTNLEKLAHYMKPLYQEATDVALLEEYLSEYTYPECAAAKLWEEKAGEYALSGGGITEMITGAEKFKYSSPETLQKVAMENAYRYQQRCDDIKGYGSCAIPVAKAPVGGVET